METGSVSNTRNDDYKWNSELEPILENLKKDYEGMLIHKIVSDSLEHKVLSVYAPVKVLQKDFGIALSVDHNTFLMQVFSQLAVISTLSLLIFIVVSSILWFQIKSLKKKILVLT